MEFFPLGMMPDHSGIILHEAGFLQRNDWHNFPKVLSPFWRCYYNLRHGHRIIFPDRELKLGPEAIVIIPDYQIFRCQGGTPVPHFWLAFSVGYRLDPQQKLPILIPPGPLEKELLRRLRELLMREDVETHRLQIFHFSLALLHILRNHKNLAWNLTPPPQGILEARRIMETRYGEPLQISALARAAGMSIRSFSNAFKYHLNTTAGHFLIQVRVREAASRLTHTEQSIEDISDATGFPNRYYFSRVFKKIVGSSPARFRHLHKKNHAHPTGIHYSRPYPQAGIFRERV